MLLDGVRVLDLSRLVAGNQLTSLLADFGADVIKIERLGIGDTLRNWRVRGVETHWKAYSRNKRSVELDLRHPDHKEILLRLVERCDVVVDSFKPGDMERFGLSDNALLTRNPKAIIVHISGWGSTGSRSNMPGFGTVVEAASGLASRTGEADGPPQLPPGSFADMISGTYGAFAVTACLARRFSSEGFCGEIIDLSLFEPMFAIMGPQAADFELTGEAPKRIGSRITSAAPRNVYKCADGLWIALSGSTQAMSERIFTAIGRPELIEDPRFSSNNQRLKHVQELDEILGSYFLENPREVVLSKLQALQVTAGAVTTIADLIGSDFFESRQILCRDSGDETGTLIHDVIPRLRNNPGRIRSVAPSLGEHTREILAEVCFDQEVERILSHIDQE
ncbi:CaiB/BaiF CoA transferase family protein [Auritidibacter ignavus]|uniref:CaiB/BaiF CoA transferase family protein n=1 Tax=Auritidibacter ignavus TaxID=678932 RepID=UPI00109C7C8C|nr:CoA transferase [Auritidibacter ignavus]